MMCSAWKDSSDTTLTVVTERSQLGDEAGSSSSACTVERYPKLDSFKQLFKKPKACHRSIDTALPLLYTFACELKRRVDDLPSNFLNKNDETVWQFIAYRNKQISKEYRKQKVGLAEMDAFLDEAEKQNDEEEILATVDKKEKKIKRKATNEDPLCFTSFSTAKKNKKTVRFALDEDIDNVVETVVDSKEFDDTHDQTVLLGEGAKEADKKESSLKRSLKKLKETIKKLEDENLAPRSWELSGEVTGQQREENTLLETHVQFDHGVRVCIKDLLYLLIIIYSAPEITEDFTEKLEGIIKQRIKDRTFDDVIRKKRIEERLDVYRNQAIEENEMIKKSLTEVYEKEYLKATGEVKDDEKPNEQHEAIENK
uniref:CDC37_N domain-containing protein n=1 Tax=Heterorhabditis bacteriophora TaxID=37862 RepID=A0A1I7W9N9_HETBA